MCIYAHTEEWIKEECNFGVWRALLLLNELNFISNIYANCEHFIYFRMLIILYTPHWFTRRENYTVLSGLQSHLVCYFLSFHFVLPFFIFLNLPLGPNVNRTPGLDVYGTENAWHCHLQTVSPSPNVSCSVTFIAVLALVDYSAMH